MQINIIQLNNSKLYALEYNLHFHLKMGGKPSVKI